MTGRRKWLRRAAIGCAGLVLAILLPVGAVVALNPGLLNLFAKPSKPFDPAHVPPPPDYARRDAWLAFPGDNGLERSTVPGMTAIDEAAAPVDVFFIHPTTTESHGLWNVAYDASGKDVPLADAVLLQQASVFNGCCRIFAPHYRQATLPGLRDPGASALAYSDVQRAFRYYLDHENHGRPFILASHSQGTGHAVRLLQEDILGRPPIGRMVAAYLIGGSVPSDFPSIGLPICDDAGQTACLLSWNTAEAGTTTARKIFTSGSYWWQGAIRDHDQPELVCVNPLTWRRAGAAPADANPGSMGFPKGKFPATAIALAPLVPHVAGAACDRGMLETHVPWSSPFRDSMSKWLGSYHLNDYGLFYAAIRTNIDVRVRAWLAAHGGR